MRAAGGDDGPMQPTVVGVDIGGSKTHGVRVGPDGEVLAEKVVGSANIESVTHEQAAEALDSLFEALGRTGIDVVCVGSAGVNTAEQESWLAGLVGERAPGARIVVAHDTRLILATPEFDVGIGVICGTGSVAWGRAESGREARAGGWGYLLGDEGSGYWVAREAVRHALRRADGGLPPDELSVAIAEACGVAGAYDALAKFYAEPVRRIWAQRSSVVFDLAAGGDQVSLQIVESAARALVEMIGAVADQLDLPGPVALGGGLIVHQQQLLSAVQDGLAARGVRNAMPLTREPVFGAVYLARQALR
jgi:N-acetylglucosamine kinase-like BadF-type ATPase